MPNVAAPYGFRIRGTIGGSPSNFANSTALIAKTNANPMAFGDPVVQLNTGYIDKAAPGTVQIKGIFIGCEYLSISRGYKWRSQYWPGSDAAADVTAIIIEDPRATMQAQSGNGGPIPQSAVGNNVNFGTAAPNALIQQSTAFVDFATIAATGTLPFRILGLVTDPPGQNGADPTTAFNDVILGFNFQDLRVTSGI